MKYAFADVFMAAVGGYYVGTGGDHWWIGVVLIAGAAIPRWWRTT